MKRHALILLILITVAGCGESGPPLVVSNIVVTAPLPGRANTVAYMTIRNQSGETILLHEFSSPQFASIEMHETSIRDGVARMQRIGPITVDTDASVDFAPGARHLMLLDPLRGLIPGAVVAIEIHYDNGGLLIVEAPLTTRHPAANDN